MKTFLMIVLAALLAVGCGTPVDGGSSTSDSPSKDEIRAQGGKSDGIDWCDELGWYGDGICDDFCAEPDPDCGDDDDIDCTTAFVVPACEAGEMLVDDITCEVAGDECTTSELCGVVSNCLFVGEFCPQVVGTPAACPDDSIETDACTTTDCEIARGTGDQCTDIKFCEPVDCRTAFVVPNCGAGEQLVDAMTCLAAGNDCRVGELCGVRSYCLEVGEFCPQVVGTPATCPADTFEVDECRAESCLITSGTGDQCTDRAFCEPMLQCRAIPTCSPGQLTVSTDECFARGESCETVTVCGSTLHCVDAPEVCPQVVGTPPSCPTGTTEVSGCQTGQLNDGSCQLVFGWGDRCSEYLYCSN